MRVIVTGATGFVGREIVSKLLEHHLTVFQVARKKNTEFSTDRPAAGENFLAADITEREQLAAIKKLANIDAVVHSAGLAHQFGDTAREKFAAVNVLGTKNIVETAVELKVKHFILISSTAVYGIKKNVGKREPSEIDEETECRPETFYAESKLEAEKICLEICRQNALPLTILRLAPVIGEDGGGNTARLVSAIERGRFIWIGRGNNLKTLIYKKDVARAVVTVLFKKKEPEEIFNLAAEPVKMNVLVGEMEKSLHKSAPRLHIPAGWLRKIFFINENFFGIRKISKISDTIEKWLSDDVYAARKIKQKYDFAPRTPPAAAIEKQVQRYLERTNKS